VQLGPSKTSNEAWAMGFAAELGVRLNIGSVVDVLARIAKNRGLPKRLLL
jgi:hypothetical protein